MKQFSLGITFCVFVAFAGLIAYILCFEATMLGGYIPFLILSVICPCGSFVTGYALARA